MDVFFENQGLCHIGENIFKNLDFHSQLTCRLVRKSWNNMFVKEQKAQELNLKNSKFILKRKFNLYDGESF